MYVQVLTLGGGWDANPKDPAATRSTHGEYMSGRMLETPTGSGGATVFAWTGGE